MKHSKKAIAVLISSLILSSCGGEAPVIEESIKEKTNYNIETLSFEDINKEVISTKTWRVSWKDDIMVTSKASWKVSKINKKEWDQVKKGETILALEDTVWNYEVRVKRARTALESTRISYESTMNDLEKSVENSRIALENAKSNETAIITRTKEGLETSKNNLENSSLDNSNSSTALEISTLEQELDKAKLDYQTLLLRNQEQRKSHINNIKSEYSSLLTNYNNITKDLDIMLAITEKYEFDNRKYIQYIWETNQEAKNKLERDVTALINKKNEVYAIKSNVGTSQELLGSLSKIEEIYKDLIDVLEQSNIVLQDSNLEIAEIANFATLVSNYQSSVQGKYSQVISFTNTASTFFTVYQKEEASNLQSIEILENRLKTTKSNAYTTSKNSQNSYDIALADSLDTEVSAKNATKNAQINYDNIVKNKEITKRSLLNSIENARISLEEAQRDYNNLFVKSPINWVISEIDIDLWEDVSTWTKLFRIVSSGEQEIEISLPRNELSFAETWKEVKVEISDELISATISSVSNVADSNLNYKVRIKLNEKIDILWGQVKVLIPWEAGNKLLPISNITVLDKSRAFVYILEKSVDENTLEETLEAGRKEIEIGKIWGDKVEVLTEILPTDKIISSEMKNYDSNKHSIKLK